MKVTLTSPEVQYAAYVGTQRRVSAIANQRGDRYGTPFRDPWSIDIEAAAAELAFAKARDRYWQPLADDPNTLTGDVGRVQIRSTHRTNGCLITHPTDPDNAPFVLAIGQIPTYTFVGWLWGRETKHQQWWRTDTGRPAFFVPQSALRPITPAQNATPLREAA